MLKESLVKTMDKENVEVVTVSKVVDNYNEQQRKGGAVILDLLTYNPLTKKFQYQTPALIKSVKDVSRVLSLELRVRPEETFSVFLDVTTKLLVRINGLVTTLTVEAFNRTTGSIQVGFVSDNEKPEIEFVDIKKISDPIDNARKALKTVDTQPVVKKKGRPKKVMDNQDVIDHEFEVVRMETRDGSLFLCDHLLMR